MFTPISNPTHLRIDGVSLSYADRRVLTGVTLTVSAGQAVGLIGENGSGKTTLLRLIAGELEPDAGAISIVGEAPIQVGLLQQDAHFEEGVTVHDAIEEAIAPARAAVAEVDRAASALAEHPESEAAQDRYARALDAAERADAWNVDTRVSQTMAELTLAEVTNSRPVASLSGGQRARLALACLLLSAPDVLLLDEPTNHLDERGSSFLARTLANWKGPVLLASHDRAFLDEAVTDLFDLDPTAAPLVPAQNERSPHSTGGTGTRYQGNYSDYLHYRQEARKRWEQQFRDEQAALKRLRAGVRDSHQVGHSNWKPKTEIRMAQKFYGDRNARVVARRVNDARSRLETLEKNQIRKPPQLLVFGGLAALGEGGHSRTPNAFGNSLAISARGAAVEGRLAPTSFTLAHGDKLLITGPNGSGKSTLLRLLARNCADVCCAGVRCAGVRCTAGDVWVADGLSVGMLAQELGVQKLAETGGAQLTPLQYYERFVSSPGAPSLTELGLIEPADLNRPVADLSIGQQRRLELAVLMANPPDVLLLDEPTNHLSLPLVTAIEESIPNYPGTVVVASHDRWLQENWSGRILQLHDE